MEMLGTVNGCVLLDGLVQLLLGGPHEKGAFALVGKERE